MLKLIIKRLAFIITFFKVINALMSGVAGSKPSKLYLFAVGIDECVNKGWKEMQFSKAGTVSIGDEFSKLSNLFRKKL